MAADRATSSATPAGLLWHVEGHVQGVGYREACVQRAQALGVTGWVRNRRDGSVEVLAHGTPVALARLQDWLHEGPPLARVERVSATPIDTAPTSTTGFERRPTA
jgi:acylphosphatase